MHTQEEDIQTYSFSLFSFFPALFTRALCVVWFIQIFLGKPRCVLTCANTGCMNHAVPLALVLAASFVVYSVIAGSRFTACRVANRDTLKSFEDVFMIYCELLYAQLCFWLTTARQQKRGSPHRVAPHTCPYGLDCSALDDRAYCKHMCIVVSLSLRYPQCSCKPVLLFERCVRMGGRCCRHQHTHHETNGSKKAS